MVVLSDKVDNVKNFEEKMDEDTGLDHSKSFGIRFAPMSTNGLPYDPWHSTPVKKGSAAALSRPVKPEIAQVRGLRSDLHADDTNMTRLTGRCPQNSSDHISSMSHMQGSKTSAGEMEITTIQKQRIELQLLVAELKDRDRELNTMAAAHHKQLQAWEQDRQRVLALEQRCARLEDELQKRNEVIRAISKRLKVVEAREKDSQKELTAAQQQLQNLSQRQQHNSQLQHDLEEKNQGLNSTIMTLSSQVGQLQVHEEELSSMLKLKDKDLIEATNHILSLTSQLQETGACLKEAQTRESIMLQEAEKFKRRFRDAKYDSIQLKDVLQEKTIENNSQREELIRLKQENQLLRKELALAGEGESWKDELLGLARSKQERTESELLCLRQVCEKQQNDLQLLKLNLESTRETVRFYENHRSYQRASNVGGTALEHNFPQGTDIEKSDQQCQSRSIDVQLFTSQFERINAVRKPSQQATAQSAAETPTNCATTSTYEEEKQAKCNSNNSTSSISLQCCDDSSCETGEIFSEGTDCKEGTEVDLVAIINCDLEAKNSVLVIDVSPKDLQCYSPGDVTCLYVECPTPSPRSGRSPVLIEDTSFNSSVCGNQEEYISSTSRLQRLLTESQEMVASLERSSGKSQSPTQSPTSHCSSVCSHRVNHNNGDIHNHAQPPRNSQEERDNSSQIQSDQQFPETSKCGHEVL
ncbi:coiled-coil domain-containing protein 62 isoform X2 [Hoplias malabaricus]|uniref:coiled-coil domain-containing protein 62 isoform X2 n=1 Tax=Hoplias malabaricus TaxID=27720 RepID=UPI00346384A7